MIDAEQRKVIQLQAKITKVQTGYEDGIYDTTEARNRINVCQHIIALTQADITKLENQGSKSTTGSVIEGFKHELEALRTNNLETATFEEKLKAIRLLNIRVYPSEDLKTVRIKTGLDVNSDYVAVGDDKNNCGKVIFEPPRVSVGRTPTSCVLFPSGGLGK